jgi:uncharacterized membrane protein
VAAALAYSCGPITGALFLMVEKDDRFVRFHAAQSLVTFGGIALLQMLMRSLPVLHWFAGGPLLFATAVLWVVLIVKAFLGERFKVPYIGDFVERQVGPPAR